MNQFLINLGILLMMIVVTSVAFVIGIMGVTGHGAFNLAGGSIQIAGAFFIGGVGLVIYGWGSDATS